MTHTNPEPGDILLFYNAGGLARLITLVTNSPYYHVALYAGDNHVIEARPRGVVRRDLGGKLGGDEYVVIPAPEGRGAAALAWAEQQIGDDYASLQVVVNTLERIFFRCCLNYTQQFNRFDCGELVDAAFLHAGVDLLKERPALGLVPADFARLLPGSRSRSDNVEPEVVPEAVSPSLRVEGRQTKG